DFLSVPKDGHELSLNNNSGNNESFEFRMVHALAIENLGKIAPEEWSNDQRNSAIVIANDATTISIPKLQALKNSEIAHILGIKKSPIGNFDALVADTLIKIAPEKWSNDQRNTA